MPRSRVNKSKLVKKHRARFKYDGIDYEFACRTKTEGDAWELDIKSKLRSAPSGLRYVRHNWVATLEGPSGTIEKKFKNADFDSAVEWLRDTRAEIRNGNYVAEENLELTFGEFLKTKWLPTKRNLAPKTTLEYKLLLKNHILPTFEDVRLVSMSKSSCQDWLNGLYEKNLGEVSISRAVGLLKQCLKSAYRTDLIKINPADLLEAPKPESKEVTSLSFDELEKLASAAGTYGLLIRFLGRTGLRLNESLALKVSDLDFKTSRIHVSKSFKVQEDYSRALGVTKTGKTRKVPMPPSLIKDLKETVRGRESDSALFASPTGNHIHDGWFRKKVFNPAKEKSGLMHATPHTLRHTMASLMLQDASVATVSKILGHSTPWVTMSIYAHSIENDDSDVMARFDAKSVNKAGPERESDVA